MATKWTKITEDNFGFQPVIFISPIFVVYKVKHSTACFISPALMVPTVEHSAESSYLEVGLHFKAKVCLKLLYSHISHSSTGIGGMFHQAWLSGSFMEMPLFHWISSPHFPAASWIFTLLNRKCFSLTWVRKASESRQKLISLTLFCTLKLVRWLSD